jgi:hypothetical protein
VAADAPAHLGPGQVGIGGQTAADLLTVDDRQACVSEDDGLQQSVSAVGSPAIMTGHRALAAGTRPPPTRAPPRRRHIVDNHPATDDAHTTIDNPPEVVPSSWQPGGPISVANDILDRAATQLIGVLPWSSHDAVSLLLILEGQGIGTASDPT